MITEQQQFNGYRLIPNDTEKGLKMVLEGPWKSECEKAIIKNNITGLRLSFSNGWSDVNVDFLKSLPTISDLEIYNWDITDISPLESLPKLEQISLECNYRKPIDFSSFGCLQYCFLRWRPKSDSIFSVPSLKALNIINYPYEDLQSLRKLSRLTELKLVSSKLRNLIGIEKLDLLVLLDLYRCTKLESLDGIQGSNGLITLEIESCKKIENLQPLSELTKLNGISVDNCGKIESLSPLKSCVELSELSFIEDTNIEDGEMGIFMHLPVLKTMWFANRRHYSYKREDIRKILESRQF